MAKKILAMLLGAMLMCSGLASAEEVITGDIVMDERFNYGSAAEMYEATGASLWGDGSSVDVGVENGALMFKSLSTGTDGIKLPVSTETENEGKQTIEMKIKRSDGNTFWQIQFFGKEANGTERYFTMLDLNKSGLVWKDANIGWGGAQTLTTIKGMEPQTTLGVLNTYMNIKLVIDWNTDKIKLFINDNEQDIAPFVFNQAANVVKVSRIDLLKQSASADNTVTSIDRIRVVNGEINNYTPESAYEYKEEFSYTNVEDVFENGIGKTSAVDANIPGNDPSTLYVLDGKGRLQIKQSTANGETAQTNGLWMPVSASQSDVKYVEMRIKRNKAAQAWYNMTVYGVNSQGARRAVTMLEHVNNKNGLQWKGEPWSWVGGGNIKTLKDGRTVDSIAKWTVVKLKINFANKSVDGLWIDGEKQDTCPKFFTSDVVALEGITFSKQVSTSDGAWVGIDYIRVWGEQSEENKLDVELMEDSGTYTVNAVMNDLGYFKSNIVVAYYDENGKIIGIDTTSLDKMTTLDNGMVVKSASFTPNLANIKKAKVMAVDSLANFAPMCNSMELTK